LTIVTKNPIKKRLKSRFHLIRRRAEGVIDSNEPNVFGEGDWMMEKPGEKNCCVCQTSHLAVDVDSIDVN